MYEYGGEIELEKEEISNRFKNFAIRECRGVSDLYEYLALNIAEDDEIIEIASNANPGQPIPNLLFGAVQYLLLKEAEQHELREYYSSIVDKPRNVEQSYLPFRNFCFMNRSKIIVILKSKLVQTNEVRRCAYLYPSFCLIYDKVKKPLSIIEIGTSAGLQLLWDKYCYSYNSNEVFGDMQSNVHINSEIRGEKSPFLLKSSPPVASRYGIDLNINDLTNSEDYLWLKSLIWPEHKERLELFERAANNFKKNPVKLIEGDGVSFLPKIVNQIPQHSAICIFHTHVANQIPKEAKYWLLQYIQEIGKTREVFHLYNNMWDSNLHLDYFLNGKEYNETIAVTDGHGRWFQWKL